MSPNNQKRNNSHRKNDKSMEIICRCNEVNRGTIETAIVNGCKTLNEIFDSTNAGVGACGGTCRRKLAPMLEQYLKDQTFPSKEELQTLSKK